MTHGSLFSGIGGFDLAAQWMGWENKFHCEWNEFGQRVLKYYWPNAQSYEDITKADFYIWRGRINILTGGFPCQPFSTAGERKGTEDNRYLWPEMLRAIREISPSWIVGENVRGIVSWSKGMVFEKVCSDLEIEGYQVQPFVLPACAVNAPHRRDRVWFVAHSQGKGGGGLSERERAKHSLNGSFGCNGTSPNTSIENDRGDIRGEEKRQKPEFGSSIVEKVASNSISSGLQGGTIRHKSPGRFEPTDQQFSRHYQIPRQKWEVFPTQSPVCGRNDGISRELDGITFSKWRNESIKAYGNAILPQVAYQIFQAIKEYNSKK